MEQAIIEQINGFKQYFVPSLYVFGILAIAAETLLMVSQGKERDRIARWVSIACGALSFGFGYLFYIGIMYAAHSFVWQFRLFDLGFAWYAWVACFLINDGLFYLSHRLDHEVRLFWCCHVVHHSGKHYDLTTGIRGSAVESIFKFPFYVWVPLFGIHPLIYPVMDTAFKFIGLSYHVSFINKMGFLDKILVTPSNHRVHHARNIKYLDKNYSGFFILWDKFFGSYEKEHEKPDFGTLKELNSYNLLTTQFHEFSDLWQDVKNAPTFSDKLKYLFMPPGWKHDGSGKTSRELQLESPA